MLYEYECPKCSDAMSAFRSVDERHDGPECFRCLEKGELVTSVPGSPVMNPARPVHKAHNA